MTLPKAKTQACGGERRFGARAAGTRGLRGPHKTPRGRDLATGTPRPVKRSDSRWRQVSWLAGHRPPLAFPDARCGQWHELRGGLAADSCGGSHGFTPCSLLIPSGIAARGNRHRFAAQNRPDGSRGQTGALPHRRSVAETPGTATPAEPLAHRIHAMFRTARHRPSSACGLERPTKGVERHGSTEQEALETAATHVEQQVALRLALDTFGDNRQ